jgi:hypothetical protein
MGGMMRLAVAPAEALWLALSAVGLAVVVAWEAAVFHGEARRWRTR